MAEKVGTKRTLLDNLTLFFGFSFPLGVLGFSWLAQDGPQFIFLFLPCIICFSPLILITNFRRATEGEPSRWRLAHGIATVMIIMIFAVPILFELVQIINGMDVM